MLVPEAGVLFFITAMKSNVLWESYASHFEIGVCVWSVDSQLFNCEKDNSAASVPVTLTSS